MGTRSTIGFIDKYSDGEVTICKVYQQYDGYLSCVGLHLGEFLKSGTCVNGIGMDDKKVFNGLGCLAAQYIAEFKRGAGSLYMTGLDDSQQYDYNVVWDNETMTVFVRYEEKEYTVDDWIEFCNKEEEE